MSLSEARRFLENGMDVADLRERMEKLGARATVEDVAEELVLAARESGFDFTLRELREVREKPWRPVGAGPREPAR